MNEAELKQIEERARKATPGPWVVRPNSEVVHYAGWNNGVKVGDWLTAVFIAHSRQDIPALVQALRKAVSGLEKVADDGEYKRTEEMWRRCVPDCPTRYAKQTLRDIGWTEPVREQDGGGNDN